MTLWNKQESCFALVLITCCHGTYTLRLNRIYCSNSIKAPPALKPGPKRRVLSCRPLLWGGPTPNGCPRASRLRSELWSNMVTKPALGASAPTNHNRAGGQELRMRGVLLSVGRSFHGRLSHPVGTVVTVVGHTPTSTPWPQSWFNWLP